MARSSFARSGKVSQFSPHTRGWPGFAGMARSIGEEFSPHTRGWPDLPRSWRDSLRVLPAHAGMARTSITISPTENKVLPAHAGMARTARLRPGPRRRFSPHTRGWPGSAARAQTHQKVLPAHAGMARMAMEEATASPSVLPAHAGMARAPCHRRLYAPRSPRTRGDGPLSRPRPPLARNVLPAHAGMARFPGARRGAAPGVLPAHAGMAR